MKVKDLIKMLKTYNQDMELVLYDSYADGFNKLDGINVIRCVKPNSKYTMCDYDEHVFSLDKEREVLLKLELTSFEED